MAVVAVEVVGAAVTDHPRIVEGQIVLREPNRG